MAVAERKRKWCFGDGLIDRWDGVRRGRIEIRLRPQRLPLNVRGGWVEVAVDTGFCRVPC